MKSSSEHVNCVGVDAKYWKQRSRHILVFCKHPKILQRRVKADMIPPTIKDLQMETFRQILQWQEESKIVNTVQFSSVAQSCPTLCDPMNCSTPGLPVHHQLTEFTHSFPLSQWCHPAISSCRPLLLLPPIPPSIRVFSNESTLRIRWPKYWSFSFSISLSNEHPGLISQEEIKKQKDPEICLGGRSVDWPYWRR